MNSSDYLSNISRALDSFKQSYTYIDFRCAYVKINGKWISLLSTFRFKNDDYHDILSYHEKLKGLIHDTSWFKINLEILEIDQWRDKISHLEKSPDFSKVNTITENFLVQDYNWQSTILKVDRGHYTFQINASMNGYVPYLILERVNRERTLSGMDINSVFSVVKSVLQIEIDKRMSLFSLFLFPIYIEFINVRYYKEVLSGIVRYHPIFKGYNLIVKHVLKGNEKNIIRQILLSGCSDEQGQCSQSFEIPLDMEIHQIEEGVSKFVFSIYDSNLNVNLTDYSIYAQELDSISKENQYEDAKIEENLAQNRPQFINIKFGDYNLNYYNEFVEIINWIAYDGKLFRILPIALRCLFENILYDIFQTGLSNVHTNFYFLENQGRARDFSDLISLLNILKEKDFKPYHKDAINQNIIDLLKEIQRRGNLAVHEILRQVDSDFARNWEDKIDRALQALLVLYKKIQNKSLEITDQDTLKRIKKTLNIERFSEKRDDTRNITQWKVIIQEDDVPIQESSVINSLIPDKSCGVPLRLNCSLAHSDWQGIKNYLKEQVETMFAQGEIYQFAVFSLARITFAMHLGFLLTNKVKVRYSQYQRDLQTWSWLEDNKEEKSANLCISGLFKKPNIKIEEVIVKVSLSVKIFDEQLNDLELSMDNVVEISIDNPTENWLKNKAQIVELGITFRDVLANLRNYVPNLKTVHLFYAGPIAGAIAIGRQINVRMAPRIQLYEFNKRDIPNYQKSILLE